MAPAMLLPAGVYTVVVFAFGFLFGTFRVTVLVPWIGAVASVLVEVPFLLLASAAVVHWLSGRVDMGSRLRDRLAIGGLAFAILQLAEAGLAGLVGPSGIVDNIVDYIAATVEPGRLIGLAAQIIFGLMPAIILSRSHHV